MKTSHIMCISNISTDLCFTKQRIKTKKYFCKSCLQCFSSKDVLTEHKEVCMCINGAQSVRSEKGTIVPFKVYTHFECNLESVESYEGSYSKKY